MNFTLEQIFIIVGAVGAAIATFWRGLTNVEKEACRGLEQLRTEILKDSATSDERRHALADRTQQTFDVLHSKFANYVTREEFLGLKVDIKENGHKLDRVWDYLMQRPSSGRHLPPPAAFTPEE